MARSLCISVTFLHPVYHGRITNGREGEWPPSPMRLFQALTTAAFGGCAGGDSAGAESFRLALRWLEAHSDRRLPEIVAPTASPGAPCTLFVPNNDLDIIARAWSQNKSPPKEPAELKTAKVMHPHYLGEPAQVHFLWQIDGDTEPAEAATVCRLARRVVALGWGLDLVACEGRIVDPMRPSRLEGELWKPIDAAPGSRGTRRVPIPGSLRDLEERHSAFLKSMKGGVYTKPPALAAYREVVYRRASDAAERPFAAFALRPVDGTGTWRAFRQERAVGVAAMLRHAAWEAAKADLDPDGWRTQEWAEQFVAGHGPKDDNGRSVAERWPRFSYVPLPSIGHAHADGMIRRVLIAEPLDGNGQSAAWAGGRLNGAALVDEATGRAVAVLDMVDPSETRFDATFLAYSGARQAAQQWASVTPVILPGYDDGKPDKRSLLLARCLAQAGYDPEAFECVEARRASWCAASPLMSAYRRPRYLQHLPALHVRLRFYSPTRGPVTLGAGRHCGLGVFALESFI